jgi:hypothetical protein
MFLDMVAHDILDLKLLFSSLWKIEDIVFGDSHGKHCLEQISFKNICLSFGWFFILFLSKFKIMNLELVIHA